MTVWDRVRSEMTKKAITVGPEEHLYHAFAIMNRNHIRHLPVLHAGELVGMLSDRDIFRHGVVRNDEVVFGFSKVGDAMTKGVWTCKIGDRLGDITDEMLRRHVDALPVVNESGAVVGIITSTDLLAHFRRQSGVVDAAAQVEDRILRVEGSEHPNSDVDVEPVVDRDS